MISVDNLLLFSKPKSHLLPNIALIELILCYIMNDAEEEERR